MRAWLCLLAVALSVRGSAVAQETADFEVATNLVPVTLTATGRDGFPVLDLKATDFTLLDNGKARPIQYLWRDEDLPLTVGLVVDVSGSQAGFIDEHQRTLTEFLHKVLRPQDRAFLIAVGRGVKLLTDVTGSMADLERGIAGMNPKELFSPANTSADFGDPCKALRGGNAPGGSTVPRNAGCGTPLWNGLHGAVELKMKALTGRKALIVLTDGQDAGSTHSLSDVIQAAQAADSVVYTVRYGAFTAMKQGLVTRVVLSGMARRAKGGLLRLAGDTGGRGFDDPKGEPGRIFAVIEQDLRNQYVLGFTLAEGPRDGRSHKLEVKTKRAGVKVQTRKGYQLMP